MVRIDVAEGSWVCSPSMVIIVPNCEECPVEVSSFESRIFPKASALLLSKANVASEGIDMKIREPTVVVNPMKAIHEISMLAVALSPFEIVLLACFGRLQKYMALLSSALRSVLRSKRY